MEEGFELVAHAAVEQNGLRPAFARAQHVAVGEAAARHQRLEIFQTGTSGQQIAHVDVDSVKARAVEGSRHLNVGVNALLAQHRHFRTRTGRNVRRGDVFVDVEGELHVQAWILIIGLRVVLLIGTFRVITQALHLPGGFRPPHAQRGAAFAEHGVTVSFNDEAVALNGFTQIVHAVSQAMLRQNRFNRIAIRRTHLNHGAQLFVKQRSQTVFAKRRNVRFHATVAGEGHLCQGHQQAAVGTVVVGQQLTLRHQRLNRVVEAFQLGHVTHVGWLVAELAVNLRQRGSTQRVVTFTQVNQQQGVVFGRKLRRNGVTHVFHAGKRGDDQRQRRGHLALLAAFLPAGFHRHGVFAHRNGQAEGRTQLLAHRLHGFIQARVFARVAGSGHPVGGKLNTFDIANLRRGDVGQRFTDGQTGRGREVQQRDRGAFTQRHRFAVVAVEARGGHGAVRHRDLPRADHLVTGYHTGHGTVADGHQEGFLRHSWQVQHAIDGFSHGNALAIQRFARRFTGLHVAGHLRRFTEQDVERQIDRLVVEMGVAQSQVLLFGRFTDDGIRRALAAAQLVKQRQLIRRNSQHVALLGFVTPDLQRAHARLIAQDVAQVETATAAAVAHQFRHGVGQTARAHVVDKEDRVSIAQLPAAVDHFLAATLHLRVVTLHGREVEIRIRLAGGHRRGRAAAQTDVHRRAAEHDQLRADDDLAFLHVIGTDVADPARQHDRFVVAAQLFAVVAVHFLFIGTEVTVQRRTTKFVVKRRAAQRAFGHDIQRGHNALWLAEIFFPRLFKARDTQVGDGETDQTRFWFCTTTGRPFVTDFTAGAGRRTRPRGDRRRVVVGFNLHQDMRGLLMEVIAPCFAIGEEAAHLGTFHHRGVVFIGRQHVVRRLLHGVFDHFEQRLWLLFAVNNPVGIENLVAAVLRVRLREHVEFNVVRVTVELNERILQVVDLVFCQRQAETQVGVNQRLTALPQQVHALYRRRLMVGEKLLRVIKRGKYALHHAVVQFSRNRLPLRVAQGRGFHVVRYAALQTVNLAQATVVGDVGGFGRPGGDGARTRRRKDQFAG